MKKRASILLVLLNVLASCATAGGPFKQVAFQAPSQPDPELRPYLKDVHRIGVLSTTNIEPLKELDIEKVMDRLAEATARGLGSLAERTVVGQDEIRWNCKDLRFDSTGALNPESRVTLRDQLPLDALVLVELKSLKAQVTPMSPSPYGGMTSQPGFDLSVDLQVTLINLRTGETWTQRGEPRRNWQPVQAQLLGDDQAERQLLQALAGPLKKFLDRLAPPPNQQVRHFDLGEK
ncbi:MAG: hypothetical protein EXS58_16205 [Candidatus Latescibacteria bacterium]|nr:hypothetical protein [Candidatus Latescibacterota bacterium]